MGILLVQTGCENIREYSMEYFQSRKKIVMDMDSVMQFDQQCSPYLYMLLKQNISHLHVPVPWAMARNNFIMCVWKCTRPHNILSTMWLNFTDPNILCGAPIQSSIHMLRLAFGNSGGVIFPTYLQESMFIPTLFTKKNNVLLNTICRKHCSSMHYSLKTLFIATLFTINIGTIHYSLFIQVSISFHEGKIAEPHVIW